ncbi:DUF7537 family lipoprotein [Halococcus qingdaonensis]|uniref:DUF7537 family lipoprotein n=1 Tax=Halococcus qingdaonensis TaxID=224402 RepID=UPI002116A50E|nr:hypothetical protein [Halococcus qingdaonensis]
MRKAILGGLFAAAVVLAGCNGVALGGDETPSRTVTPAAVPTDEPTPTAVPRLAPGLTEGGVTDAFALGEAHASALDNTSYTLHESYAIEYANGTAYNRGSADARLAANDSRYYVRRNASGLLFGGGAFARAIWSNGERVLVTDTTNESTSYDSPRNVEGESMPPREALTIDPTKRQQLYAYLGSVETRVTGTETRNGTTLHRAESTSVTNPAAFEIQWTDPRNLSLVVFVDSRGLVHEYRLDYTASLDGTPVDVRRHVRYTNLGNTTIERPSWYDAAIANVSTATTAD